MSEYLNEAKEEGGASVNEVTRAPLIVAGSGRSGTTWLQDGLAEANGLRPIFEPLHPMATGLGKQFAYSCLAGDVKQPVLARFLQEVFDGHFCSLWTDHRMRWDHLLPEARTFYSISDLKLRAARWRKLKREFAAHRSARNRSRPLVKFIRANLMLEWLRVEFDARIVVLVRHPGAVIESQLNLGDEDWKPTYRLERFRKDEVLNARLPKVYRDLLRDDLPVAGALALIWCIENEFALTHLCPKGVEVVFYEELIRDSADAWRRAATALGLDNVPDMTRLMLPSQQASRRWQSTPAGSMLASKAAVWTTRLSRQVKEEIKHVCKKLEVTLYSMDDPEPLASIVRMANLRALDAPRKE